MSPDRTVLEHLLDGRDALVLEVQRLTTAIEELDTVIGRLEGSNVSNGAAADKAPAATRPDRSGSEPVKAPGEVEPKRAGSGSRTQSSTRARKAPARRGAAARQSEAPKSIRVHVLDMLAADEREFGLAEIIERIHAEGIQAHDDAVRSITIKLMKDGKVERVGRGQYRLARRGANARAATAPSAAEGASSSAPDSGPDSGPDAGEYTPPLNLGQPWEQPDN